MPLVPPVTRQTLPTKSMPTSALRPETHLEDLILFDIAEAEDTDKNTDAILLPEKCSMNRREFIASTAALAASSAYTGLGQPPEQSREFPASVVKDDEIYV
jgi:hypothetical protein